jgi:hypothetical protein
VNFVIHLLLEIFYTLERDHSTQSTFSARTARSGIPNVNTSMALMSLFFVPLVTDSCTFFHFCCLPGVSNLIPIVAAEDIFVPSVMELFLIRLLPPWGRNGTRITSFAQGARKASQTASISRKTTSHIATLALLKWGPIASLVARPSPRTASAQWAHNFTRTASAVKYARNHSAPTSTSMRACHFVKFIIWKRWASPFAVAATNQSRRVNFCKLWVKSGTHSILFALCARHR